MIWNCFKSLLNFRCGNGAPSIARTSRVRRRAAQPGRPCGPSKAGEIATRRLRSWRRHNTRPQLFGIVLGEAARVRCYRLLGIGEGVRVWIDWLRNGIPIAKETSVLQDEAGGRCRGNAACSLRGEAASGQRTGQLPPDGPNGQDLRRVLASDGREHPSHLTALRSRFSKPRT
jgi:hypothetical protein